ncbi:MAG: hypothetical protein KDB53_10995, partial [Planctomycetes bacterium]|nr:hypothetical protein [Planctomycetota bacterium]
MRKLQLLVGLALTLGLLLTGSAHAQLFQTLPAGFDAVDGNATTPFPQNFASPEKWQFVYDSSNFAIQGPIVITDLFVRAVDGNTAVNAFNFASWQITMGASATDYGSAAHNSNFAANFLSSTVVKTSAFVGGPVPASGGSTGTWIPMTLDQSFSYDPSTGNDLIIQIEKCNPSTVWGASMDCVSGIAGSVLGNRYGNIASCSATAHTISGNEFVPIIRISYATSSSDDLAVATITAPVDTPSDCGRLATNETVTATLINLGMITVPAATSITMAYSIDGGPAVSQTFVTAAPVPLGATASFSFTTPADLSAIGNHTIDVTLTPLAGDTNSSNDTKQKTVRSGSLSLVQTFPWSQNFDGHTTGNGTTTVPANWRQDQNDATTGTFRDWVFNTSPPSSNNGPISDHTSGSGHFAFVEDDGNQAAVNLITPCFNLTGLSNPAITFWIHSNNSAMPSTLNENFLHIDVIAYPGPTITTDIVPAIGHLGNSWQVQIANLSAFNGQTVQVQFRGSSNGGSNTHDIAIDDVNVLDFVPSLGQPPQPGLAVLDINGSQDVIGFSVSSMVNGPYFASASTAATIDFHFEGSPNQAIVFLAGTLNPAVANFPGIGALDIGTAPPMGQSIPGGINL